MGWIAPHYPKFLCERPNPQSFKMWLYLERGSLKKKLSWSEVVSVDPNPVRPVSLQEEKEKTQGEGGYQKAKQTGFGRNQPLLTLTLDF